MSLRFADMPISPTPRLGLRLLLSAIAVAAVVYVVRFVGPYLSLDPAYYDYVWPWRYALWAHLAGGVTALLLGPVQLWLGLTGRRLGLHRFLGRVYLGAVGLSLAGASYLIAKEIRTDWVFASGLLGLACAWTVTTGCGYLAIRRGHRRQHREWMIRSYVVASAFIILPGLCRSGARGRGAQSPGTGNPGGTEDGSVAVLGRAPVIGGAIDSVPPPAPDPRGGVTLYRLGPLLQRKSPST